MKAIAKQSNLDLSGSAKPGLGITKTKETHQNKFIKSMNTIEPTWHKHFNSDAPGPDFALQLRSNIHIAFFMCASVCVFLAWCIHVTC